MSFKCQHRVEVPCMRFDVPEDGFPSIEDWTYCFTSVLLDGLSEGENELFFQYI